MKQETLLHLNYDLKKEKIFGNLFLILILSYL